MILHIFTEEMSSKIVFEGLLKKILPESIQYKIYPHQGKQDLEKALKTTIPTISKIPNSKILITVDQNSKECTQVKKEIERIVAKNCYSQYLIRIICRELECWYLGDLDACTKVYPKFCFQKYQSKKKFRNVDLISNAPKILIKIIPELKGRKYLPKVDIAKRISPYLNIKSNRSISFNNFITGLNKLLNIQSP